MVPVNRQSARAARGACGSTRVCGGFLLEMGIEQMVIPKPNLSAPVVPVAEEPMVTMFMLDVAYEDMTIASP